MDYTIKVSTDDPRLLRAVEDAIKVAVDVVWDMADLPDDDDLDEAIDQTSIVVTDASGRIVADR